MGRSQEYIDNIFSNKLEFEKEVLQVKCDEDRKEVMELMCAEACSDSKLSLEINFLKMKSINDLSFKKVNITFVQLLLGELISLLKEKRYTRVEIETIKANKQYLKFIYELVQIYMQRYSSLLYKEVVNTFFDLIATADRADNLSPLVLEVITANEQGKSLLDQHGSGQILYKPEQAWMRVKQARNDKNHQVQSYQIEIARLIKKVDFLKLNISAIVAARALTGSDLKKISSKLLLDMFTDEDDITLHVKKTMFSYVAAGDKANVLVNTAQQAQLTSKLPAEQRDFKNIAEFFKKCKNTNSEKFLLARFDEYKQELETKSAIYRDKHLKLQTLRDRPLDSFDVTLKKVKEAMVYNLQHL